MTAVSQPAASSGAAGVPPTTSVPVGHAGQGGHTGVRRGRGLRRLLAHRSFDAPLFGLIAALTVAAGITTPSLWYDEAATVASSTRSWASLAGMIENVDAVHTLYYALMHLWFDLVGYSPLTLRLPSAVFAGAAVTVTVLLAARFGSRGFAATSGIVLLVIPRFTWAGIEGRSYALTMLLAVTLTLLLVHATGLGRRPRGRSSTGAPSGTLETSTAATGAPVWGAPVSGTPGSGAPVSGTPGSGAPVSGAPAVGAHTPRHPFLRPAALWALYTLVAILGITVFIYLALVVAAHAVTVLGLALARRLPRGALLGFAVTLGAVLLASIPLAVAVVGQSGQLSWVDPIDARTVRGVLVTQFSPKNEAFAVVSWVLASLGAVVLFARRRSRPLGALLVPWLVLPLLAIVVASVVITPLYSPRYLTFCLPAFALLVASALVPGSRMTAHAVLRMLRRPGQARCLTAALTITALLALALLSAPSFAAQRRPEAKQDASWSQAAERVASLGRELGASRPAVVFGSIAYHPGATARVIEYAYPQAFLGLDDVTLETPLERSTALWETAVPLTPALLAGHDTAILVSSGRDRAGNEAALAAAGFVETERWTYTNLSVTLYRR